MVIVAENNRTSSLERDLEVKLWYPSVSEVTHTH